MVAVAFLGGDRRRGMNCLALPASTEVVEEEGGRRGTSSTFSDDEFEVEAGLESGTISVVEYRVTSDLARRRKGSDNVSDDRIVNSGKNSTCCDVIVLGSMKLSYKRGEKK